MTATMQPPPFRNDRSRRPKPAKRYGNLTLAYRYNQHYGDKPWYIRSDARHKGDFDRELSQLMAALERCKNKPGSSGIAWAEIYDWSNDQRGGPVVATYHSNSWHSPTT